jgi:uncharacterized membrane protein
MTAERRATPARWSRQGGPMHGTWGPMGGLFLFYALLWIAVVATVVVALWRGMQAQERIAKHLEGIERALTQRPLA